MHQIRSCVLDIETSNLSADFGVLLCAVVKADGKKAAVFRADELNPDWDNKRSDDSAVVAATVEEMAKYDIWIAHNGNRFDIPFLRSRLAKWKMPPLPSRKLVDPVLLARNKLRLSYNSLERVAAFLGVNMKTGVAGDRWLQAALDGCRASMDYIVRHCVRDVYTLERVIEAIKHYSSAYNSWGSGF